MSLAGRILRRVTGQPDARPGYPTAYGDISIDKELPYLREQIRAYASVAPIRVTGPTWLDNFTGETFEMRRAYRNALLAEPSIKAALVGKIAAVQALGLQVKPYDDTPIDQTVADWVRHTINASQGGLPAVVDSILTPGLTDGFSVGEKVWRREDRGRWKGKVGLQKIKAKD